MFDLEKAKEKEIDAFWLDIMKKINENNLKEENCILHEFVRGSTGEYVCKNCGCEEDGTFVSGYLRGLEHARGQQEKKKLHRCNRVQ